MRRLSKLRLFWTNLFPPISLKKALSIAKKKYKIVKFFDGNAHMYRYDSLEDNHPFWVLCIDDFNGPYNIKSSHIVAISKITGEIAYDGGAGDEG